MKRDLLIATKSGKKVVKEKIVNGDRRIIDSKIIEIKRGFGETEKFGTLLYATLNKIVRQHGNEVLNTIEKFNQVMNYMPLNAWSEEIKMIEIDGIKKPISEIWKMIK